MSISILFSLGVALLLFSLMVDKLASPSLLESFDANFSSLDVAAILAFSSLCLELLDMDFFIGWFSVCCSLLSPFLCAKINLSRSFNVFLLDKF